MSVNGEEAAKRYVVRFRDVDGRHRTVTVNAKKISTNMGYQYLRELRSMLLTASQISNSGEL